MIFLFYTLFKKSYTDLEQSKKLAEFLPLESADMQWIIDGLGEPFPFPVDDRVNENEEPCWSLAALLGVLPKEIEIKGQCYAPCLFPAGNKWLLKLWYNSNYIFTSPIAVFSDNPVDACYEMIIKLHEQKLL